MNNMPVSHTDLGLSLPTYNQLLCQYDPQLRALWYYMNPQPRSCFSLTLLREIRDLQQRLATYLRSSPEATDQVHYLVLASATPATFNLGGDLKLFARLIHERDRDALYDYGQTCVDAIYHCATNLGVPTLTTIALVQGSALGGGFESALANHVLIAERSAEFGFPEILFNLFPGMGAYNLLSRRIDPIRVERLLYSGEQHKAPALWEMGIVDVLAPPGEGVHTANEFMRRHSRTRNGQQAIQQVRQRVNPLTYQELLDVVEIWVDAALRLTARDLRMMTRLVSAQEQLEAAKAEPEAVAA